MNKNIEEALKEFKPSIEEFKKKFDYREMSILCEISRKCENIRDLQKQITFFDKGIFDVKNGIVEDYFQHSVVFGTFYNKIETMANVVFKEVNDIINEKDVESISVYLENTHTILSNLMEFMTTTLIEETYKYNVMVINVEHIVNSCELIVKYLEKN